MANLQNTLRTIINKKIQIGFSSDKEKIIIII